jgi:hypothetical protein
VVGNSLIFGNQTVIGNSTTTGNSAFVGNVGIGGASTFATTSIADLTVAGQSSTL